MKLSKIALLGALAFGVSISATAIVPCTASASSTTEITQSDMNYLDYNDRFFEGVDKASYAVKDLYFHHNDGTLKIVNGSYTGAMGKKMTPLMKDCYNAINNGDAYRGIDVPAKFEKAHGYYRQALSQMRLELSELDSILLDTDNQQKQKQKNYSDLVKAENNYTKYKNLYYQEVNRVKTVAYGPAPSATGKFTQGDRNFMNYVAHYYTDVEKKAYNAKFNYYWNGNRTISLTPNGELDLTQPWMASEEPMLQEWENAANNSNAYRSVDVSAKFASFYRDYWNSVGEMMAQINAFNNILLAEGRKDNVAEQKYHNELITHENNYYKYKSLYLHEYANVSKMYK